MCESHPKRISFAQPGLSKSGLSLFTKLFCEKAQPGLAKSGLSICFLASLESQESLRASRRAFIVVALLFSSPPATRTAGSAVRLRTTLSWATVAMADDEESFGSDDDLHHSSDPSSEEEDEDREVLPRRGPMRGANGRRVINSRVHVHARERN
jgi:hypothetical protein